MVYKIAIGYTIVVCVISKASRMDCWSSLVDVSSMVNIVRPFIYNIRYLPSENINYFIFRLTQTGTVMKI